MSASQRSLKQTRDLGLGIKPPPICQINSRQDAGYLSERLLLISRVYLLGPGVIFDHQALGHTVRCRERQSNTTGTLILLCLSVSHDDYHADQITVYKSIGCLHACLFVHTVVKVLFCKSNLIFVVVPNKLN